MIDPEVWWRTWEKLCKRFKREPEQEEAGDYLTYLEGGGFDTEGAIRAAEVCWATREFFPRPADFVSIEAATGWRAILAWEAVSKPHEAASVVIAARNAVHPRSMRALNAIGGLDALRGKMATALVREHYLDAFEHVVIEDVQASLAPKLLIGVDPSSGDSVSAAVIVKAGGPMLAGVETAAIMREPKTVRGPERVHVEIERT